MRKSDFIKVLKVSVLIDLGMYLMALINNGFDFHDVDILNILSSFPLVFIFYLKNYRVLSFIKNSGSLKDNQNLSLLI